MKLLIAFLLPLLAVVACKPSSTAGGFETPLAATLGHALGDKKLLDIRLQFPNIYSLSTFVGDTKSLNTLNFRTQAISYGQKSYTSVATTNVYTLPHPSTYYETGHYKELGFDARQLVSGDYGDVAILYDRIVYHFPNAPKIIFGFQGYSVIGGKDVWMSGGLDPNLLIHEEGHNDGLHHAHRWVPSNLGDPVDPNGKVQEYGDSFDIMGGNNQATQDFNVYEKMAIGWIPSSKVIKATTGTHTYRIYRSDTATALTFPLLGVTFPRVNPSSPSYNYFVSYRANKYPNDTLSTVGAYLQWALLPNSNPNTYLLDHAPGTDWKDGMWPLGSTLNDPANFVAIKPLKIGGVGPKLWIDIDVTLP